MFDQAKMGERMLVDTSSRNMARLATQQMPRERNNNHWMSVHERNASAYTSQMQLSPVPQPKLVRLDSGEYNLRNTKNRY